MRGLWRRTDPKIRPTHKADIRNGCGCRDPQRSSRHGGDHLYRHPRRARCCYRAVRGYVAQSSKVKRGLAVALHDMDGCAAIGAWLALRLQRRLVLSAFAQQLPQINAKYPRLAFNAARRRDFPRGRRFESTAAMVGTHKPLPTGLSFDLRDLFLAQVWTDCRAFRMVIELDFSTDDGDEYEEVLVFYRPSSAFRWFMAWRSASEIVVQNSSGQTRRFATLAEALEDLSHPQQRGAIRRARPPGSHTRGLRSHEEQHGHR